MILLVKVFVNCMMYLLLLWLWIVFCLMLGLGVENSFVVIVNCSFLKVILFLSRFFVFKMKEEDFFVIVLWRLMIVYVLRWIKDLFVMCFFKFCFCVCDIIFLVCFLGVYIMTLIVMFVGRFFKSVVVCELFMADM